jgi:hypothetical protein
MAWKWLWMHVFLEGEGGGLFGLIGLCRAGEVGVQVEIQPIKLILERVAHSMSGELVSQMLRS